MECSSGAVRTAYDKPIDGRRGAGRPKLTWKKLKGKDCREWKLTTVDPQERCTWRSGVRSAMWQLASYLEGGPLMWMMPLHLHVNQKSDYDDDNYTLYALNFQKSIPSSLPSLHTTPCNQRQH